MASVNKVILVGNLGADPEIRYTAAGKAVASFTIATSFKGAQGADDKVEWTRCTAWERLAEIASEYLRKGSAVYVEGRLQTSQYQDKQGVERFKTEVIVGTLQMLDKKPSGQGGDPNLRPPRPVRSEAPGHDLPFDDEIPF